MRPRKRYVAAPDGSHPLRRLIPLANVCLHHGNEALKADGSDSLTDPRDRQSDPGCRVRHAGLAGRRAQRQALDAVPLQDAFRRLQQRLGQ